MAEILFNGRRLDELKVVELREELNKRGLSRKGIKSALIKRFEKALLKERLEQESPPDQPEQLPFENEDDTSFTLKAEEWSSEETFDTAVSTILKNDEGFEFDTTDKDAAEGNEDNKDEAMETEHSGDSQEINETANKSQEEEEEVEEGAEQKEEEIGDQDNVAEVSLDEGEKLSSNVTLQQEVAENSSDKSVERLGSVTSMIEPSFQKDEELIYEGDVDDEEMEDAQNAENQVEMDLDEEEEEKDELIVDFTAGELDLDPKPSEEKRSASFSSKPLQKSEMIDAKSEPQTTGSTSSKLESGDSSEERCNVWVSGLSQLVSASDLKTLFSPFGQVISAKVVARARSSKNQRYGFVTMATPEQAEQSIENLNGSELKGKKITVELTKGSPFVSRLKKEGTTSASTKSPSKDKTGEGSSKGKPATATPEPNKKGNGKLSSSGNDSNRSESSTEKSTTGKRIIAVEKTDGRKELYTTSGKRRREEQRAGESKRNRSRSPRRRRSPARGRIVSHRLSPVRRVSSPPLHRRGPSPPFHRRSPPLHRRMQSPPPMHRRPPSPPMRRGGDDVRRDLIRREMERSDMERRDIRNRLGGRMAPPPPPPPPAVHEMEMRLEEQRRRMITEREREREALRREMHMEHTRKEQELARQMQEIQEREARERSMLERQQREFMQLQRNFRERESHIEAKEREMKEKEMRERQRLELLERQREKEIRDKEKRYRDQLERDLKEKELMMQKEQDELKMRLKEQERVLMEKERQIREEQERLSKIKDEVERKQRRKDDDDKDSRERDRKDRDNRRSSHMKEDKEREDSKDRPTKRPAPNDEGIFGRLGTRDSQSQSSSHSTAIVKETQISPNLMYRRIESSSGKQSVGRSANPYSQNQSRSKALESLSSNYATPRQSSNPVAYPQPSRYAGNQYSHSTSQSVGYGGGSSGGSASSNIGQFTGSVSSSKINNLLKNPELLSALSNVARGNVPTGGTGGYSGIGGYSSTLGMMGSGSGSVDSGLYGSGAYGSGLQSKPGFGMPGFGMGLNQAQFAKHFGKIPQEPDRYTRRIPSRPEPYSHFNKRM